MFVCFQAHHGYTNLTGVDYSQGAVQLATSIVTQEQVSIKYQVCLQTSIPERQWMLPWGGRWLLLWWEKEWEVERDENDPWCSFETGKHSDDKNRVKQRKCVFNDMLKVQRKQNLQLYLFETVKYTINCSVILLNGGTDFWVILNVTK